MFKLRKNVTCEADAYTDGVIYGIGFAINRVKESDKK